MNLPHAMNKLDHDSSPESFGFDLLLSSDDEDCISFEEMSDITNQSSPPPDNDIEFSLFDLDNSENTSLLEYFEEEDDDISNFEYNSRRSEELWESNSSSQSIDTTSLQQSDNSSQSDASSPPAQPPELDKLHNLPHQIVERPRYSP